MKYSETRIEQLYLDNLNRALVALSRLPIANGRKPGFQGLTGWIFEQTIHHCLEEELSNQEICVTILDQQALQGRAKVDLLIGKIAIELKVAGWFGDESAKYQKYRAIANKQKRRYLYLTRVEGHLPFRKATETAFGKTNTFFLGDGKGVWQRFVKTIATNCQ
jgi:hypothetical protein